VWNLLAPLIATAALLLSGCEEAHAPSDVPGHTEGRSSRPAAALPVRGKDANGEKPADFYLRFTRAIAAASSMDDLVPFVALPVRAHLIALAAQARKDKLASAKRETPEQVSITSEEIEGDLATLKLTGTRGGKSVRGKATIVREDTGWKVSDESWEP
jgi:hypothetical protein